MYWFEKVRFRLSHICRDRLAINRTGWFDGLSMFVAFIYFALKKGNISLRNLLGRLPEDRKLVVADELQLAMCYGRSRTPPFGGGRG